jgi:threonyl-tRNA synthetase
MCVVGQREAAAGTVAVRTYTDGDIGSVLVRDLVSQMAAASASKQNFASVS